MDSETPLSTGDAGRRRLGHFRHHGVHSIPFSLCQGGKRFNVQIVDRGWHIVQAVCEQCIEGRFDGAFFKKFGHVLRETAVGTIAAKLAHFVRFNRSPFRSVFPSSQSKCTGCHCFPERHRRFEEEMTCAKKTLCCQRISFLVEIPPKYLNPQTVPISLRFRRNTTMLSAIS